MTLRVSVLPRGPRAGLQPLRPRAPGEAPGAEGGPGDDENPDPAPHPAGTRGRGRGAQVSAGAGGDGRVSPSSRGAAPSRGTRPPLSSLWCFTSLPLGFQGSHSRNCLPDVPAPTERPTHTRDRHTPAGRAVSRQGRGRRSSEPRTNSAGTAGSPVCRPFCRSRSLGGLACLTWAGDVAHRRAR